MRAIPIAWREAQTVASLNHPNLAAIYGIEESSDVRALVMELVDGDDLSQRIARGAMPVDEALPIAKQIAGEAAALDAKRQGTVLFRCRRDAAARAEASGGTWHAGTPMKLLERRYLPAPALVARTRCRPCFARGLNLSAL